MASQWIAGVVGVDVWDEFPWLMAGFSTREGGESKAYSGGETGEQNLGWTAEDAAEVVAENRRRFLSAVSDGGEARGREMRSPSTTNAAELVTVLQFHSGVVQVVKRGAGALATDEGKAVLRGDGLMTNETGLMLGVQTADCVPVLVADTRTRTVAAFHAGWRGTLARIVERGVDGMQVEFGARPKDLVAAMGPSIGPCCFAVGEEVRREFNSQFEYAGELFRKVAPMLSKEETLNPRDSHSFASAQLHMNLWEANRRQLLAAGVPTEAISMVRECSACARLENGRRKYFSHRAEQGITGRMLSVIGVRDQ